MPVLPRTAADAGYENQMKDIDGMTKRRHISPSPEDTFPGSTKGRPTFRAALKMREFCHKMQNRRRNGGICFLILASLVIMGMEHNQATSDYLLLLTRHPQPSDDIVPDDVMLEFVPRLYESAGKKFDDLKTGKSCVWIGEKESDPWNHNGVWHCQDCGETGTTCKTLKPKGLCPSFPMINWDAGSGVRQRSHFRKEAVKNPLSWVTQTLDTPTFYESAVCSPDLTLPCFDINRCAREDGPMKVYLYNPERTQSLLDKVEQAQQLYPSEIQYTTNHDEACLFVVAENSFKQKKDMIQNPLYMAGQNHFLINANVLFASHGDRTKPHSFNMEFAATLSASIYDAQVREGYDMVNVMPQPWKRPPHSMDLPLHRTRRLLLSFKGRIERWKMPFEHHRWIASEYWRSAGPDVLVDAACGGEGQYEITGQEAYGEILLNSTFVFAPGGGGVGSFRLTEALAADAVPLVVSHSPLPFSPEIDWSGCVVHISEARVVDAPRILRQISEAEIRSRRERCRELYRGIYGHEVLVALRIWRARTLKAHRKRDELEKIEAVVRDIAQSPEKFG